MSLNKDVNLKSQDQLLNFLLFLLSSTSNSVVPDFIWEILACFVLKITAVDFLSFFCQVRFVLNRSIFKFKDGETAALEELLTFTFCFPSDVLMYTFGLSTDPESVDRENFSEERMYPDYSQQRQQQV